MPQTRIFCSHSSQDNLWCREFVSALQGVGDDLDIWYDEQGLTGGAGWVQTLQRELQARDVFLLIVSPDAWASTWVQEEIQLALATRRTILPVLHKPAEVDGFLLTRQWVDVIGLDASAAAKKVLVALGSPVVFPAPAAPKQVVDAPQIVPPRLQQLGFVGRLIDGVAIITPPMCEVPAGAFLAGTDPAREPEAAENEERRRSLEVARFFIGRTPVTVAEYAFAVAAGGMPEPRNWERQAQRPDHPVVQISWKQAQAYVGWLATATGEPWRLPTEEEWEKAARGVDGRIYPWGDQWDPSRANTNEGGPESTTPVGAYPGGASPYGALDMAGNVNEWCGIPANSPLARVDGTAGTGYLAGGSWDDSPTMARAAHRSRLYMGERTDDTGFRLVWQPS